MLRALPLQTMDRFALLIRREGSRSGAISVGIHLAIVAGLSLSLIWSNDEKIEKRKDNPVLQISLMPGPRRDIPQPSSQIAAPKNPEKPKIEADRPTETKVDQGSDQDGAGQDTTTDKGIDAQVGGASGEGLIWTPPAPKPNAAAATSDAGGVEKRITLPVVELKQGATDPQLLSYDYGRFTDAASVSEATRLTGTGSIVMNVSVDDEGHVSNCQITVSSGSKLLDDKACLLIRSYRYRAARDQAGKPRAANISEVLEWARDGKFQEKAATSQAVTKSPITPSARSEIPTVRLPGSLPN